MATNVNYNKIISFFRLHYMIAIDYPGRYRPILQNSCLKIVILLSQIMKQGHFLISYCSW